MGIMTRLLRLCKADLHGVMDQLEDKNLLLKQYLREMEDSLQAKEEQLRQNAGRQEAIRRDLEARTREIDKIEQDLTLSLRKEKDDIARLLIRRQRGHAAVCGHLREQLRTLEEERQRLGRLLQEQRMQYDQLKVKATAHCTASEQRGFDDVRAFADDLRGGDAVDEQEIELELLRRKEALHAGGDA